MKYLILTLILTLGVTVIFNSCKSKDAMQLSTEQINSKLAEVFENKKYKCILNESEDLRLCVADDDPQGDRQRKIYGVYNSAYELVYGPKKVHGKVYWSDDNHVMIEIYPRVIDRNAEGDQIRKEKIYVR